MKTMKIGNKMKLIAILVIVILLGLLVVSVTAQTISQYRQRCRDWNTSQDREDNSPYSSQGCYKRQYRSCWNSWTFRGCC